jgi:hypothetical protein
MTAIQDAIRGVLGEDAVAAKKTFSGDRLEIIGWIIDLKTKLLTIGQRCLDRALYGFVVAREFEPMQLKQVQRLASWGRRYGTVNKMLLPFTSALDAATRGKTNAFYTRMLPLDAQRAVQMIRVLLLLIAVDEAGFARPLDSFKSCSPTDAGLVAEFDASLAGVGVLWYVRDADGCERLVGVAELDIRSLGFGVQPGCSLAGSPSRACGSEATAPRLSPGHPRARPSQREPPTPRWCRCCSR